MKFDENNIDKFISAYEDVYGEQVTREEATIMLRKLVNLYRVIMRPLPKEKDSETTQPS